MPQGDAPQMLGDAELQAVLRIERRGVRAEERCQVQPHVGCHARDGQQPAARQRARVERGEVGVGGHHVGDDEVDGDEGDKRRGGRQRRQQQGCDDEPPSRPRERKAAGKGARPLGSLFHQRIPAFSKCLFSTARPSSAPAMPPANVIAAMRANTSGVTVDSNAF